VDIYAIAMMTLLIIVSLLIPVLALLITRGVSPDIDYRFKRSRFESGNPPVGRARGFFVMQYYPYLLMFSSLEPFVVLLVFIFFTPNIWLVTYFLVSSFILLMPVLYYVYKQAGDIDLWREE